MKKSKRLLVVFKDFP